MRLLIVAATAAEITPLVSAVAPLESLRSRLSRGHFAGREIDVLITGVGMVPTAAWLGRVLALETYDAALNFGLCGAFDAELAIGQVVHVVSDELSEVGAEDGERFVSLHELGLSGPDEFPDHAGAIVNRLVPDNPVLARLPTVRGITVNTVHGYEPSIARVVARHQPQVESMEGAAFLFTCLVSGVPCAQVRAVSNVVERRNREAWRIGLAIEALNTTALSLLAAS
jgi:futalosine hydrolase